MLHRVEAAALRIAREVIERAADHHLALVALAPIGAERRRHRDRVEDRLDRLGHHRLQCVARHRQLDAGQAGEYRRVPCHGKRHLVGADLALRRGHAHHMPALLHEAGDRTVLHDVHAQRRCAARIAPGHRVVPHRPGAALDEAAQDGEARGPCRVTEIQAGLQVTHLPRVEQFGVDAIAQHRVRPAGLRVEVMPGVGQGQHAALAEHDVEVQFTRELFVLLQRELVEACAFGVQIVRAHDGRVAPGVAAPDPAGLEHGDVGDAMIPGQVVRRGQTVPATADDDHVVAWLRLGVAPRGSPVAVAFASGGEQVPGGVAGAHRGQGWHHGGWSVTLSGFGVLVLKHEMLGGCTFRRRFIVQPERSAGTVLALQLNVDTIISI